MVDEPDAVAPAPPQGGASAAAVNGTVYVFPGATPDVAQPSSPDTPSSISVRLSCMAALPTSAPMTQAPAASVHACLAPAGTWWGAIRHGAREACLRRNHPSTEKTSSERGITKRKSSNAARGMTWV